MDMRESSKRPITRDRLERIYRKAGSPYRRPNRGPTDGLIRWIADKLQVHRTTVSRWLTDEANESHREPDFKAHWGVWRLEYELGIVRERMEAEGDG